LARGVARSSESMRDGTIDKLRKRGFKSCGD
jgi:hypothetical protein